MRVLTGVPNAVNPLSVLLERAEVSGVEGQNTHERSRVYLRSRSTALGRRSLLQDPSAEQIRSPPANNHKRAKRMEPGAEAGAVLLSRAVVHHCVGSRLDRSLADRPQHTSATPTVTHSPHATATHAMDHPLVQLIIGSTAPAKQLPPNASYKLRYELWLRDNHKWLLPMLDTARVSSTTNDTMQLTNHSDVQA